MGAFAIFEKTKPLFDFVYLVILQVVKVLLVITVLIACMMVAGRFIEFVPSFPWTEEVILSLMTYFSLLGAGLAVRKRAHIRMVALDPYLNDMARKILDVLADFAILFFAYVFISYGWDYAVLIGARGSFTSMPNVSLFWRFLPIPLGGALIMFFGIEVTVSNIKAFFVKSEKEEQKEEQEEEQKEEKKEEQKEGGTK